MKTFIIKDEMGETCGSHERNACKILLGKPEVKRRYGSCRIRWDDNIRMNPREMGCEGVDWIHLAQDWDVWRVLLNMVMNLRVL